MDEAMDYGSVAEAVCADGPHIVARHSSKAR